MKYFCSCGNELKKEDIGRRHMYYHCEKCNRYYGVLGERYWWSVAAIDELTGEIVYDLWFDADGSYRNTAGIGVKEEAEE